MKCQRCSKPATYHITEVLGDEQFEELHLCEDCAKKYLYEPQPKKGGAGGKAAADAPPLDLADLGEKQCEACGVKFVEFRNTGRLGCPHDYDAFRDDLLPLLESIHGEARHQGKAPRRMPKVKANQLELARLRREMTEAVTAEEYERAARLRDQIKQMEEA